MTSSSATTADPLVKLPRLLSRLEGGSMSIESFRQWFMSSEWETLMASNSAALHLGWDIENILFQLQDYPEHVAPTEATRELIALFEHFSRTHDASV